MNAHPSGSRGLKPYPQSLTVLTALLLLLVFCIYYAVAAWHLPRGAGPDSEAHYDVARFVYEKGRLAVLPDDAGSLLLTPYGTTRALRPPLSYLVAAGMAGLIHESGDSLFKSLRFGSALLCALAVMLTFLGLILLYERYWLALAGALLFGLLPQLAFIASYTNDDSGAIFAGTALAFSIILILRYGLTVRTSVAFGLATGLVLLSKFTAWVLLPAAAVFILPRLVQLRGRAIKLAAVLAITALIGGGWWIVFNMIHYGVDDPLLTRASRNLSQQHATIANPENRGYASRGIGASQLIIQNYKNFIGESFKAVVGNLDWLRLRVGWPQYLLYGLLFVMGMLYFPFRLIARNIRYGVKREVAEPDGATFFYLVLFFMLLIQIVMYVRFNLYHDVQIQGKYLLPVLLPMLVLSMAALTATFKVVDDWILQPEAVLKGALGVLAFVIIIGTHVHALTAYVIPYYFQQPLNFRTSRLQYLDFSNLDFVKAARDVELSVSPSGLLVKSMDNDPQIVLKNRYCKWLAPNSIAHIVLHAERVGHFKIYIDQGNGFRERSVHSRRYAVGSNHLIIPFGTKRCKAIRLDPAVEAGEIVLKRVGFASMSISNAQ